MKLCSHLSENQIFDAVARSSDDAIIALTLDGNIIAWNDAATRIFGYQANDVLGKSLDVIVPVNLRSEVAAILERVGEGERVSHFETERLHKDGFPVEVSLSVSPIFGDDGKVAGAAKIAHELSEERLAQAKFRLAFEASPSGMVIVNESGRIVLANAEMTRMFGYDEAEFALMNIDALVPEEVRGRHEDLRSDFEKRPTRRAMGEGRDLFARRKDGSRMPVEVGLNPIRTRIGTLTLAVVNDIAARKEIEIEMLRQTDELRRSNEELEQFAYVASHDLQEPLRMISSFTQLLAEHNGDQLDASSEQFMRYIFEGTRRMKVLVRDLLEYSRTSAQPIESRPVDLHTVLSHVQEQLRAIIQETGTRIEADRLPIVLSDESELVQVFINLLSNAIKFRSESPPVICIDSDLRDGWLQVNVQDNGIGIDPRFYDVVFRMFQRLHDRRKYEGSGIGLAIVRRVIERRGGRIWLETADGAGARFCFTLPVAR